MLCRQLQILLPGCDVVKMVCSAPPLLCSDVEGSVARKLLWMQEMVGTLAPNATTIPHLAINGDHVRVDRWTASRRR
jgi:hypothetical protein